MPASAASSRTSTTALRLLLLYRVAGRVVGEVEAQDRLRLALATGQGRAETLDVDAPAGGEEREGLHPGPVPDPEEEVVVLPVLVGQEDRVAGVDEEVRHQRQGVGDPGGDDGGREALALQGGVLGQEGLPPGLAELGAAGGRGVGQGVGRGEPRELLHHRREEHRLARLLGDADGHVEPLALLLGLGGLGEDALREEDPLPEVGQHRQDGGALLRDGRVQLGGERIRLVEALDGHGDGPPGGEVGPEHGPAPFYRQPGG